MEENHSTNIHPRVKFDAAFTIYAYYNTTLCVFYVVCACDVGSTRLQITPHTVIVYGAQKFICIYDNA